MALTIDPSTVAAKLKITDDEATKLINRAIGRAAIVAPCLLGDDLPTHVVDAATDIIESAVLRREAFGDGAVTQQQTGPHSVTRQGARGLFWPEEITDLQALCRETSSAGLPRGEFPPPPDLGSVFAGRPKRR